MVEVADVAVLADVDVDVEVEVEVEVDVDVDVVEVVVGVRVGVGVDAAPEELAGPGEPELAAESPAGNTTMFAVKPLGTVTTQKLAPPAPEAWSALVTPPTPLTEGSMVHGRPLQPAPEHSILRPKLGGVLLRGEFMKIGFHASFTNVLPLASVLAPATKGAQFPRALDPSPQTQASSTVRPGKFT